MRANGRPGDFRDTRAWRKLRAQVLEEEGGVCHLCGWAGADSVDHLIPVRLAPHLVAERANLRAAHRRCNIQREVASRAHPYLASRPAPVQNRSRDW